jgi:hydroxymethylglutaryl-CoA lyase
MKKTKITDLVLPPGFTLPARVRLREVAPRDGFQSLPRFIPTGDKLKIIEAIVRSGVRELETTSFVSPKAVPQLRDAAELMARVPRQGVVHAALVPNFKGAERAIGAGVDRLVVVISASQAHNQANLGRTIEASIRDLDALLVLAAEKKATVYGAISVAFGCPYQGRVAEEDAIQIASACISRGATGLILADTAGMANPVQVAGMVRRFQDRFPGAELVLHFHNNRGTAMANLLAALLAGATAFDTALGGIGGCPNVPRAAGNLPTEDVVFMLEAMGVNTGIDPDAILSAARLLEETLGCTLPKQVPKSGSNVGVGHVELCKLSGEPRP